MEAMLVCLVLFGKAFIKLGVLFGLAIVIEDVTRKIVLKRRASRGNEV